MAEFVRVKDTRTGHEFTASKAWAEKDSNLKVLSKGATDVNGKPAKAKPNVKITTNTEAAAKPAENKEGN